ncbi:MULTISPECIES: hypothetical protein [Shewanella]|uniref:hypothetical protein n=1 Tax=Shewanella TaxID=22 RepID=UPI0000DDD5D5|nr:MULTISPECIES: hypothetical protein [Shewanella]ADT94301.1 hypothetical protein Sbal678_2144 [Shewanella baltica OS678]MCU8010901.1 hypothetical protein [Shewanella sp. SM74]RBP80976.1 hypothetical protein DET47_104271 [Shewanella putrefaciens]
MSALGWVITFGAVVLAYRLGRVVVRVLFDLMHGDVNRLKLTYVDANGQKVSKIVEIDDDIEQLIQEIKLIQQTKGTTTR